MFYNTFLSVALLVGAATPGAMTAVSAVDPISSTMTTNNTTATTITTPHPSSVIDTTKAERDGGTNMLRGAPAQPPLGKELKLEDLFAAGNHDGEKPQNRNLWNGWAFIMSNYDSTYLQDPMAYFEAGHDWWGNERRWKYFIKPAASGGYIIESDGKCLDYDFNNNIAYMHECHGGNNQVWHFYGDRWSDVEMRSEHDWSCLDRAEGGSSLTQWKAILWNCHGGANQRFNIFYW
jgi:hypothetical protein